MRSDYVVGDLMTIDPVVTRPSAPLEEAARLLEAFEVSGLPVVDDEDRLLGVISQTDLVRGRGDVEVVVRGSSGGMHVADVMTAPAITVGMLTPLVDAARLMRDNRVHRLVAVDDAGHAIGVLSAMDFVTLYADG